MKKKIFEYKERTLVVFSPKIIFLWLIFKRHLKILGDIEADKELLVEEAVLSGYPVPVLQAPPVADTLVVASLHVILHKLNLQNNI